MGRLRPWEEGASEKEVRGNAEPRHPLWQERPGQKGSPCSQGTTNHDGEAMTKHAERLERMQQDSMEKYNLEEGLHDTPNPALFSPWAKVPFFRADRVESMDCVLHTPWATPKQDLQPQFQTPETAMFSLS